MVRVSKSRFFISESDNQVSGAHLSKAQTGNINYGADCIKRKGNDPLSETKLLNEHNTQKISTRKTNNGESVVVISNLDTDHDITTVVDQLLSKNEFSDASSIFVVVPTSDDNDSDLSPDCSTVCIQLSKHYPNWNEKQCHIEEPEMLSRRNSSNTRGFKIFAIGNKYCMEGVQKTATSFHENESIYHHTLPNSCSHEEKEERKNKLCQISTSTLNMKMYHSVGIDTMSDRPCCCASKIYENHNILPEYRCVANVVSDLDTHFRLTQGLHCDGYHRVPKMNVTQQASLVSINRAPMSITPCAIPPCIGHPGCHPSAMLQTPYGTTRSETTNPVYRPNKSQGIEPEPVSDHKQSESCQCSPDKLKGIFENVFKGKATNFKSAGCSAAADNAPTNQANNTNKPLELVSSDSDDDEDCEQCSHPKYINGHKIKCTCSDKSRTISTFKQHQPSVSKTPAGPRPRGWQCCCCDDYTIKDGPELEALVSAGRVCQMEPEGTYCQASHSMAPTSTAVKKTL